MVVIGLTGGIGSGKSTVSRLLAQHGALTIDADTVVHELFEADPSLRRAIAQRFGPEAVKSDGIDRSVLASIVFEDPVARRDLNSMVHPLVRDLIRQSIEAIDDDGAVVIVEIPLLVESGDWDLDGIVVVDSSESAVLDRLEKARRMSAQEIRSRIKAQASREVRKAAADFVISNDSTMEELAKEVERCWDWIEQITAGVNRPDSR